MYLGGRRHIIKAQVVSMHMFKKWDLKLRSREKKQSRNVTVTKKNIFYCSARFWKGINIIMSLVMS